MSNIIILLLLGFVFGFQFELATQSSKCFNEELPRNFDVFGEYNILKGNFASQVIDIIITDEYDKEVLSKKEVEGKGDFSFIARDGGTYKFCFYNRLPEDRQATAYGLKRKIAFELFTGSETKDYEDVARREHLKPVEVSLMMMTDSIRQIYSEYLYFNSRQDSALIINQKTHRRVLTLSLLFIFVVITFYVTQTLLLKRFLKREKVM